MTESLCHWMKRDVVPSECGYNAYGTALVASVARQADLASADTRPPLAKAVLKARHDPHSGAATRCAIAALPGRAAIIPNGGR